MRHGKIAYAYEIDKDEVCAKIVTKYPLPLAFDLHKKTHIRPFILKGFPVEIQELINDKTKAKNSKRINAIAKLNRIIRQLRKHCYGDEGGNLSFYIIVLLF